MRINKRFLIAALVVSCCGFTGCISKDPHGVWYKPGSYSVHAPKMFSSMANEEDEELSSVYAQESPKLHSETSRPDVSAPSGNYTTERLARTGAAQNSISGSNFSTYQNDHVNTSSINAGVSASNYQMPPQNGTYPNQGAYNPNTGASATTMSNGAMSNPNYNGGFNNSYNNAAAAPNQNQGGYPNYPNAGAMPNNVQPNNYPNNGNVYDNSMANPQGQSPNYNSYNMNAPNSNVAPTSYNYSPGSNGL